VNVEMTPDERAAFDRQERERDQRVDETPMMRTARALVRDSYRWMSERYEPLSASADPVLKEALEIASYDTAFVSAKVHRALHGRDLYESDDDRDEHPIQNDWNGSAKIAWICLDRSEIAWRLIAQATGEEMPSMLADETRTLRQLVEEAFPRARSFVRPGFDEPDR
jgi:hypothetical protein